MEIVPIASAHVIVSTARGGLISRQRLFDKFTLFNQGAWIQLLIEGRECCETAVNAGVRRRRRTMNDSIEHKAERAQMLVMMGEVFSGRRAAPLAPGNDTTLTVAKTFVEQRVRSLWITICSHRIFGHGKAPQQDHQE